MPSPFVNESGFVSAEKLVSLPEGTILEVVIRSGLIKEIKLTSIEYHPQLGAYIPSGLEKFFLADYGVIPKTGGFFSQIGFFRVKAEYEKSLQVSFWSLKIGSKFYHDSQLHVKISEREAVQQSDLSIHKFANLTVLKQ